MERLLGADVSHWDGFMDWIKAKAAGIRFGFYKMSDFYRDRPIGFTDSKMLWNYTNTKKNDIINGGYMWLQPRIDPTIQARYYTDLYMKYPTDLSPVVDFEDKNINSPTDVLWRLQTVLEFIEGATGRIPIVYTSAGYMRQFSLTKSGFLSKYPLWIAQYPYYVFSWSKPYLTYTPWKEWKFWQYTAYAKGSLYGSQKSVIDLNFYNGDYKSLKAMTEDYIYTPFSEYQKVQITATLGLRVRSSPAVLSNNYIYTLPYKSIVEVELVQEGWGKIVGKEQWIFMAYTKPI